jgi:hypothetical protein
MSERALATDCRSSQWALGESATRDKSHGVISDEFSLYVVKAPCVIANKRSAT